jgi:NAD(P)H-flavin reductase
MSAQRFTVQLVQRVELSPKVLLLRFKILGEPALGWRAGQYIELLPQGSEKTRLPFSIASAMDPERPGEFELAVTRGTSAEALESLMPGAVLGAEGPRGSFTWEATPEDSVLLVGVGTGSAPLRALIFEQMQNKDPSHMVFLFGCRSEDELLWRAEMTELTGRAPHFRFEPTLSQASDKWTGRRGRVQVHLPEIVTNLKRLRAYVCGKKDMVSDVKAALLELGVPAERIRAEGY